MENEEIRISYGSNQLKNRELITLTLHYGTLDKWFNSDLPKITTTNRTKIEVGTEVRISDSPFVAWLRLQTYIDRTNNKKYLYHAKGSIKYISNLLGYSDKSGLYKVIKVLYDVGLIDIHEEKKDKKFFVDLIVYPFPIYADSNICNLVKIRKWEDRQTFGMSLSRSRLSVDKSPLETSRLKSTEPVDKSPLETSRLKSTGPVDKSPLTNNNNISNDNNISNINNNHLIKDDDLNDKINNYLDKKNIDENIKNEFIRRIIKYPPKSNKYEKYFDKVLESINSNKKEIIPEWLNERKVESDKEQNMSREEFERERKKYLLKIKNGMIF